jgi:hypothetical protein
VPIEMCKGLRTQAGYGGLSFTPAIAMHRKG